MTVKTVRSMGLVKPAISPFDPDNAGQFDSHAEWGEGQANEQAQEALDIAKERLKEAMKDAAQEASSKGWGSVVRLASSQGDYGAHHV